ncbi:tRNA synthetases class I-domain-containing protein [Pavlovales sp. CCMP2436]|nr:tRNA synthetases class I-domain-containing protein [Pavlovales sp. CCMP2436]
MVAAPPASMVSVSAATCPVLPAAGEEMATKYEWTSAEEPLYAWWESKGYFQPKSEAQCAADGSDPNDTFTISMPPPNVTGALHMGHVMFVALQDILVRFNRMRGKRTLWLPGTDHAGIATQMLVDRALKAQGIERAEIGREAFIEKVWEWKAAKGGYITQQIRRLGASCDWQREKFTLDPDMSAAVTEAFVQLHAKGLVYQGDYLCNWSPTLRTAVSDLEVIYTEEVGQLYTFNYPVVTEEGAPPIFIPVATTRPETMLGDMAVCVHPEDPRYAALVGRKARVPFTNREIPIIADEYVDREFGTGALKITPAHDVNDYELGKKHSLPLLNIMNKDATLNEAAGAYAGLDRYEARRQLWADLQTQGLAVIEPLVSSQWFVRAAPLAAPALAKVRSGEVLIIPARFEKVYFNWLDNINDWCISRQLWWGHRIPVWYGMDKEGQRVPFVARDESAARVQAEAQLGAGVTLVQDPDVLDTWFSSGIWPFATLGWPQKTADMRAFYPTQLMETGYDILFFWVARMMMMGIELTGQAPFNTVYMHGLVRDDKGQKMSKTKGNVVDPIDAIAQYGTDALRYTLVTGSTPGQLAVTGPMPASELASLPLAERYIVSRCHELVDSVTEQLSEFNLGAAGTDIARFLWDEYADWYIEASKTRFQAIWQRLPRKGETLMLAAWPRMAGAPPLPIDALALDHFGKFQDTVRAVRNARAEYKVEPAKKIAAVVCVSDPVVMAALRAEAPAFALLARVDPEVLSWSTEMAPPDSGGKTVHLVVADGLEVFLPLATLIDAAQERARLEKQGLKLQASIERLAAKLGAPGFSDKAPAAVVAQANVELKEQRDQLETIRRSIADL